MADANMNANQQGQERDTTQPPVVSNMPDAKQMTDKGMPTASKTEPARFRPGSAAEAPASSTPDKKKKEKKEPGKFFKEYYGVAFLFLIAAFVLAGYYFLNPLVTEFKLLNQDIGNQQQVLQQERNFLDSLNNSIAAAEAISPEVLDRVNEALPEEIGIPKLLKNMARIAEEHGVDMSGVQFTEPQPIAEQTTGASARRQLELTPIELSMKINAPDYAAMRAFLTSIEENLRVLDVRTITVSANEQTGALTYDVRMIAYSANGAK